MVQDSESLLCRGYRFLGKGMEFTLMSGGAKENIPCCAALLDQG
jgi:hypothetical protein